MNQSLISSSRNEPSQSVEEMKFENEEDIHSATHPTSANK
jgi:hypothetical protein